MTLLFSYSSERENWPLVSDEPVKIEKYWLKFKVSGILPILLE